ncbi:hypothetical protein GCM10010520_52970 [Rhizobium viscosum]
MVIITEHLNRTICGAFVEKARGQTVLIEPEQQDGVGPHKFPDYTAGGRRDRSDPRSRSAQEIKFVPFAFLAVSLDIHLH